MAEPPVIVVGASAGGVDALTHLVREIPADLPAVVLVAMHVAPFATGYLPAILTRAGPLPASHATDGEPIQAGRIYIAPPDHHLLIQDGHIRLGRGPRENRSRPAIDPLSVTARGRGCPCQNHVIATGRPAAVARRSGRPVLSN